jgi:hypothetical protein
MDCVVALTTSLSAGADTVRASDNNACFLLLTHVIDN